MHDMSFHFTARLWLYSGKGAWHFVTLPKDAAAEIRFFKSGLRGFKMVPVKATIGTSTWKTSIFPDSKSGSYVLAVKVAIRKTEGLGDGDKVEVHIITLP